MIFLLINTWRSKYVEDAKNWIKIIIWKEWAVCWFTSHNCITMRGTKIRKFLSFKSFGWEFHSLQSITVIQFSTFRMIYFFFSKVKSISVITNLRYSDCTSEYRFYMYIFCVLTSAFFLICIGTCFFASLPASSNQFQPVLLLHQYCY